MQYKHEYGVEMEELIRKICKNRKKSLLRDFLFDLLSPAEYKDLAVRWQIVKMLDNRISQRQISKALKVSVATVTRGSRELLNKTGGFRQSLDIFTRK